jgi:hypothetical protein
MSSNHATVWFGILASGNGSPGYAVCRVGEGLFAIATTAIRATYGRSVGIAVTAASSGNPSFQYQVAGSMAGELSGLPDGGEGDWVVVDANGALERTAVVAAGQDVIGRCTHTGGDVQVAPGVWDETNTLGGTVGATLPIDLTSDVTGTLPVANGGTGTTTSTGSGSNVLATSPTLVTPNIGAATGTSLNLSGGLTLGTALPIASGGTGATALATGVIKSNGTALSSAGLGTAGQVLRTNSGATDVEWSTFAGAGVVNVMDYYEVADGGASYNLGGVAVTTKNVANAFQAAYEDKIVTGQAFTLWLPPASDYGVMAYSWKEALTWDVSEAGDNIAGFEIVGSGVASIIIPDSSAGLNEKLYIAGAGPDCLSMLFAYRRMFWVGDEDATSDCVSVLRTSVDMDVLIDECQFYSIQTSSATSGVVYLDTMGAIMRRTYFHGCTADNNGAVVYVGSGCFGATFEHVQWYPWEKGTNPFGGTHYDKGTLEARYHVIIAGGGTLQTASRVTFDNCTWAESGVYAAVKCDPGANLIDTVHFKNCTLYGNLQRMVECVANTRHVIVEQCSLSHNGAGVPTIDMQASTCERLSVIRTEFSHSGLWIYADNGQHSVDVISCTGGTYVIDGVTHLYISPDSTYDALTSDIRHSRDVRGRTTIDISAFVAGLDFDKYVLTHAQASKLVIRVSDSTSIGTGLDTFIVVLPAPASEDDVYEVTVESVNSVGTVWFAITDLASGSIPASPDGDGDGAVGVGFAITNDYPGRYRKKVTVTPDGVYAVPSSVNTLAAGE